MTGNRVPAPHADPWVDVTRGYVTKAVRSLAAGGVYVDENWLDPRNPRDATIVFTHPASNVSGEKLALVWDEMSGWRRGIFKSGHQGVRTVLSNVSYLGGGVLLEAPELVGRLLAGTSEPRQEYRSFTDLRDGLDDTLLRHQEN